MSKSSKGSALDVAWTLVLSGKRDEGLRALVALLEVDPAQTSAVSLTATMLAAAGRKDAANAAATRLAEWCVRRGDLPAAAVAAAIVERAGGDAARVRVEIARVFGKGSKRLADVSAAPPPLPKPAPVGAELTKLSGDALLDRAASALDAFFELDDATPADSKVPELPLFSALPPDALADLLGAFEVRELAPGEVALRQGEEGRHAFVVARGALRVFREAKEEDEEPMVLAALGPGAIFGEMALVSEAPRAATVEATEPVELLVASRETLERLAAKVPAVGQELGAFCRARMVANLMRHSTILNTVEAAHRDSLMARFETKTFSPGDVLVEAEQATAGLYLIASGEVRVQSKDADGDQIVLAELGPGEVVGEISLVLRRPATAKVTAATPTVALHLSRDQFHEAIREHPTLLGELYDLATRREEETRSVVAQEALDVDDIILL